MTAPAFPNTGRPQQPWDAEVTEADRLVDQGVGSYHEVRKQLGDKALNVVRTIPLAPSQPTTPSNGKTLAEFYDGDYNYNSGPQIGTDWPDGDTPARRAFFEEVHKLDPKNKRAS